jgi:hypothetical protein
MKDINTLLSLFVCTNTNNSKWVQSPFKIDDKVYATDRHMMIIIPAELAPEVQPLEGYEPAAVLSIIPAAEPALLTISTAEIKAALKAVPTVKASKECEACEGDGEVEFEFLYGGRRYTTDDDCPLCDGVGSFPDLNGKAVPDPDKCITIGEADFSPEKVKALYQICQYFELADIDLVNQQVEKSGSLFAKDGIALLVMPVNNLTSVYTIQ